MKKIKYELLQSVIVDEDGEETVTFLETEMPWSEASEELAKTEAYGGVYEIYDDGVPEPMSEVSAEERIAALEAKLAALTGV